MNKRFWSLVSVAALSCAAPALAQAPADDPAPVRPADMADSFVAPARDADGAYATPNRKLTADEATWHMRVALNVAALGCRDAEEAATVASYNLMLAEKKEALTAAGDGMAAAYRERFGAAWQARHDDNMTRLYNFWAQPPAHKGFCAAARQVLREVATVEPGALQGYATSALATLEAPFLTAFAAAENYHSAMAAWRARHVPATEMASLSPATARMGPPGP
jgi:hypothetical protein